jgi:hypothetical protein
MIVLAATSVTAIAAVAACVSILVLVFHQNFFALPASKMSICDAIGLALAVIVCLNLYHRLLRARPTVA